MSRSKSFLVESLLSRDVIKTPDNPQMTSYLPHPGSVMSRDFATRNSANLLSSLHVFRSPRCSFVPPLNFSRLESQHNRLDMTSFQHSPPFVAYRTPVAPHLDLLPETHFQPKLAISRARSSHNREIRETPQKPDREDERKSPDSRPNTSKHTKNFI